jgi:hypothetical protein
LKTDRFIKKSTLSIINIRRKKKMKRSKEIGSIEIRGTNLSVERMQGSRESIYWVSIPKNLNLNPSIWSHELREEISDFYKKELELFSVGVYNDSVEIGFTEAR